MSLQITTQKALIGINTIKVRTNIQQTQGEQTINTTRPKVNIKTENPQVIIDQSQCFKEIGLKNYLDLTKEAAKRGIQQALKYIGTIVEDGDRMAMIGNDIPPAIPELAEKNAWKEGGFNIGLIPKSRPKIEVKGDLQIDWELGKVDVNYKASKLGIDYQRGKIDIYLKQKPSIDIQHMDVRA
jgi:hypothetical protein